MLEHYNPWHQVSRGDPASSGRSHLVSWRGRLIHLLSDGEADQHLFASMLPNVIDAREQYPLDLHSSPCPLDGYDPDHREDATFVGTLELAATLGIKHPSCHDGHVKVPWRQTTDLLLTLRAPLGHLELLALAYKPRDWSAKKRTRELLQLERAYWLERNVDWLLITPDLSAESVRLMLRRISCWALHNPVSDALRDTATKVAFDDPSLPVTRILQSIQRAVRVGPDEALRALWQSVWTGKLPINLHRSWRPHYPLQILSADDFWAQNPIATRRSAWI